jgi:predicted transcriptional regulator with HTH domain
MANPHVHLGEIVDINDPLKQGRARVRVFGFFDELEIEDIPWAEQISGLSFSSSLGSGNISIPRLGAVVNTQFDGVNYYKIFYEFEKETAPALLDEISNSYEGAQSLIYDTDAVNSNGDTGLKLFFTRGENGKGFISDFGGSMLNIRMDSSVYLNSNSKVPGANVIHIKDGKISLGLENESEQPAVLGNHNENALTSLLNRINEVMIALQTYSTAQSAITAAIPIFSPLAPALTALNLQITTAQLQLTTLTAQIISTTKSKTVSLGGGGLSLDGTITRPAL